MTAAGATRCSGCVDNGLVRPGSVFAHGVDLSPLDMQTLEENGVWLVHCGRSNMNNGVGRAPVDRFPTRSAIGTDGLDDNMWGELRTTFFRGNEGGRGPLGHAGAARLWLGNYRLAREIFGEPFGSLEAGAPADFIILQQLPEDTPDDRHLARATCCSTSTPGTSTPSTSAAPGSTRRA